MTGYPSYPSSFGSAAGPAPLFISLCNQGFPYVLVMGDLPPETILFVESEFKVFELVGRYSGELRGHGAVFVSLNPRSSSGPTSQPV